MGAQASRLRKATYIIHATYFRKACQVVHRPSCLLANVMLSVALRRRDACAPKSTSHLYQNVQTPGYGLSGRWNAGCRPRLSLM